MIMGKGLKKRKGAGFLIEAVLTSIIMGLVLSGLVTVNSSQFTTLDASRTALQTLQFAEVKASEIRVTPYNNISTKAQIRTVIPASTFEREVLIGPEIDLGGGSKQVIATVNVYKPGEAQPRFTLQVPISSQGSGNNNVKIIQGTIIDGGIIPLPAGFLEEECKWFVYPTHWSNWHGSWQGIRNWEISINSSRKVSFICTGEASIIEASYIVIGTK